MQDSGEEGGPQFQRALDHAWEWFTLHAGQRMQLVNFWLIAIAFLTSAYVSAAVNRRYPIAVAVGFGGVAVSVAFYRLERRTRTLVRIGESALKEIQAELAASTGLEEMQMLLKADEVSGPLSSYGTVIRALQWLAAGLFTVAGGYAAVKWLS